MNNVTFPFGIFKNIIFLNHMLHTRCLLLITLFETNHINKIKKSKIISSHDTTIFLYNYELLLFIHCIATNRKKGMHFYYSIACIE